MLVTIVALAATLAYDVPEGWTSTIARWEASVEAFLASLRLE